MSFSLRLLVVSILASAVSSATAAEPAKPAPDKRAGVELRPSPEVECRFATGPIRIDGKADEPAWVAAAVVEKFTTPWQKGEPAALTPWKARILWDRQYLYFHADMTDADLYAEITEHDGWTWDNDVFELFVKPEVERPQYYEFQVNAAGTKFDMFVPERNALAFFDNVKRDPFTWETAVVRRGTLDNRDDRDQGWSCEGRIPWVDFIHTGARPEPGETWRFAFCRYDYTGHPPKPNLSTNARFVQPNFHEHENYVPLKFVGPADPAPKPYGLAARTPVTSSTVVGSPDPPPPYRVVRAFPKLTLNHLIMIRHQPGSNRLWAIIQPKGGKTTLIRFADDPKVSEYETLHEFDGTATDLIFHPRFAENGYVYVGWNGPSAGGVEAQKNCIISRFTVDRKEPYKFDAATDVRIIEWSSNGHNGLSPAFGHDGMLYVTTGDGTSDSDEWLSGQDMTRLLAKLLRIDVDHVRPEDAKAGRHYSVPPDNPFVDLAGARPETWAYGFRNPWRMAVDEKTGHVWVTQNGQDLYEQVYFIRKGENYGWSVMEGSQPFYLERARGPTPLIPPTVEHPHSEARSLTGGVVYYGQKYPDLRGAYNYGDHSTGKIWIVRHDGTKVTESREIADTTLAITAITPDSHGELLVCDYQSGDKSAAYYLEPTPPAPPSTFPRKLSESGLFAVNADGKGAGHRVVEGVVPYSINSPLWSDGTYKERFVAVPGDGTVNPAGKSSWDFPEGTVLIKSFALETEANDLKSRKWIETRFLTKQQNEWVGYSYEWNDEQTDAELVESKGRDRKFTIADAAVPGGIRSQTWHYPSRAECMICHSRAAKFVLGLTTAQMNCDHDYGEVTDNQLRTWSQIGMFAKPMELAWSTLVIEAARAKGSTVKEANEYWGRVNKERKDRRKFVSQPTADTDPAAFDRLVDPADETASLELRARSYLHANCAHCHTGAGGGNSQFLLGLQHSLKETKMLDERPLHSAFGVADARIIAPGRPERSMLLHRLEKQDRGRMPPIAVSLPDPVGIDVVRRWIAAMPKPPVATHVDPE